MAIKTWTETDAAHRRHRHMVLTCDECGEHPDKIYQYDGEDLCLNCLTEILLDTAEYTVIEAE